MLVACIASPFLANTVGWIFTEMGRQPWIVYGLLKTVQAELAQLSPMADVAFTLGGFVLLYTVLGVIDVILMYRSARHGLGEDPASSRRARAAGEAAAQELVY